MPINFVTGLPRQGKTLFTFVQVQDRAKKENRPVYYCNIPEVTIQGWTEIDHPDKWMDCPNDSIVIVDELQDFWGAASTGAKVPLPILELSKHGKRGIDFYFITQDPTLVHNTPRKLCETHWHVVRAFGTEKALTYKFRGMQTDPSKVVSKGEKYPWMYPKDAFGKKDKAGNWITKPWYKSADVHNIKRQLPLKLLAIPFVILLGLAAAWYAVSSILNYGSKVQGGVSRAVPASASGTSAASSSAPGPSRAGPATAAEYIQQRDSRVPGFPHTAPAYDQVTQPTQAPYPAACVSMGKRCDCYTQQATLMVVSREVCIQIVERGFFMDWRRDDPRPDQRPRPEPLRAESSPSQAAPNIVIQNQLPAQSQQPGYLEALAQRNSQVRSALQ